MSTITAWLTAHHAQLAYSLGLLLALANGAIKIALWMHPLADWVVIAQKRPRIAALVRLLGALGIQPVAVLQAIVDFVRGKTSPGGVADAKAFATSASKPLIAPPPVVDHKV